MKDQIGRHYFGQCADACYASSANPHYQLPSMLLTAPAMLKMKSHDSISDEQCLRQVCVPLSLGATRTPLRLILKCLSHVQVEVLEPVSHNAHRCVPLARWQKPAGSTVLCQDSSHNHQSKETFDSSIHPDNEEFELPLSYP